MIGASRPNAASVAAPDTREMIGASDVAAYPQQIGANGAPDLARERIEEQEQEEEGTI
jgi:hypothetical protein